MFLNAPTTPPTGSIKWDRVNNKFQEWSGAAWVDKVLSVAGGGTGGATQAAARAGLGLGTMAVQASDSVAITGGSITGLAAFSLSCSLVFTANATYNIGTNANRVSKVYVADALVGPCGVDKFATS